VFDAEAEPDLAKADRHIPGDAEGTAEIDVALGRDPRIADRQPERSSDCVEGDTGTGDKRFEEHVAGAEIGAGDAGGRMQDGLLDCAPGLDRAGHALSDRAGRTKGNQRRIRLLAIARLDRCLDVFEVGDFHGVFSPFVWSPLYGTPGRARAIAVLDRRRLA